MLREGSVSSAAKAALCENYGVSRETLMLLESYVEHLQHWQKTTNLVAPSTLSQIWSRHIVDCAQLLALQPQARHWLDLGSGGGLPGLVLACQLKELGGSVDLIESNSKKAAFLRHVATSLNLPARVHAERIETATPRGASRGGDRTGSCFADRSCWLHEGAVEKRCNRTLSQGARPRCGVDRGGQALAILISAAYESNGARGADHSDHCVDLRLQRPQRMREIANEASGSDSRQSEGWSGKNHDGH